jgi:hypothetical protein
MTEVDVCPIAQMMFPLPHQSLLQGKQTGTVRQLVVLCIGVGVAALVQQLQIAWVDSVGLVGARSDKLTVADIIRPCSTTVCLAGEWAVLSGSIRGPAAIKAARSEGTEEATPATHRLDQHEVLGITSCSLDSVYLNGLKQIGLGIAHDGDIVGAEIAREVAERHA